MEKAAFDFLVEHSLKIVFVIFILLEAYLLFILESIPGTGWIGVNVEDVPIKIRAVCFVFSVVGFIFLFQGNKLLAYVCLAFPFFMLVFYKE